MSKRTSYNSYMNYYAATSEAYALDGYTTSGQAAQDWQPLPERHSPSGGREKSGRKHTSRKRAVTKPRAAKKGKAVIYEHVNTDEKFLSWRMAVTFVMIFAGMVALTMSFASIKSIQLEMGNMRDELALLQDEEALLKTKIAEEYDVTQIEKIATTRLNMSKPKAYQIAYISAPKQDYVVQNSSGVTEETTGILRWLTELLAFF